MSISDRLESTVEKGVNGIFSRVFRSGIKPMDTTTTIHRAMDESVQEASISHVITANHLSVYVSRIDLTSLKVSLDILVNEFTQQVTGHTAASSCSFLGPITVELIADVSKPSSTLRVDVENRRGPVAPTTVSFASPGHPVTDVDGEKWLFIESVTVTGRGPETNVVVNDSGISRRRLELCTIPTDVIVTDPGSISGSFVGSHRIDAVILLDDNQIVIGHTKILLWTHPDQSGV